MKQSDYTRENAPTDEREYRSEEEYREEVKKRSLLPEGFRAAAVPLTFYPEERESAEPLPMNLSAIILEEPTSVFTGVFTKNRFPGAPVIIGRDRITRPRTRGVLINNKVANVGVASGIADAETLLQAFGEQLQCGPEELFSASTGVIGWRLPVDAMTKAVPDLVSRLYPQPGQPELPEHPEHPQAEGQRSVFEVAKRMMTTDRYPKVRSVHCGDGRIVGVAKGAGMIEPNMATMLLFIMTDISINRREMGPLFHDVVDGTFNRISIDGDQSTSDMGLIFSSCRKPPVPKKVFEDALFTVCKGLSGDVVRNGEGTNHVIRVTVTGVDNSDTAVSMGKAVVNSPLVKTAVFGNDPNVGRIISSVGDYVGNSETDLSFDACTVLLGGEIIFKNGTFFLDKAKEMRLSRYLDDCSLTRKTSGQPDNARREMDGAENGCELHYPPHEKCVDITIDFASGGSEEEVLGSDLSYDYVKENADYRT